MPDSIQPGEYSMGSGTDGTLYATATRTATCTCAISTGTTASGSGATTGLRTTGTLITLRLCAQPSSFLSGFRWRVLFYELAVPTAEHPTGFIQFYGKSDVFFIVKRFRFPEHQKKDAESVRFLDRQTNIRMFLRRRKKTGGGYRLYYFHK